MPIKVDALLSAREARAIEPPPPLHAAEPSVTGALVLGMLSRVPRASYRWLGDAQAPRRTFFDRDDA